MLNKKALAASVSAPPAEYVEDVFSTYLYTGTGLNTNHTITNGIDLAGEGGLVWTKSRSAGYNNALNDTARGFSNYLISNSTGAQNSAGSLVTMTANSNGYTVNDTNGSWNESNQTFVSWTFRKQPKFFDVVTFTTNSNGSYSFNHSLTSSPGMVIFKATDVAENWYVWHKDYPNSYFVLNLTNAAASFSNWCIPTSTAVTGNAGSLQNSRPYVAYLFAHNAGGFGAAGTDNVISCGSFTYYADTEVNLGFEPQFLMIKGSNLSDNWIMADTMRGFSMTPPRKELRANSSSAEVDRDTSTAFIRPSSTGFSCGGTQLADGYQYIYMAIRRPMKTPTSGTEVFSPVAYTTNNSSSQVLSLGFNADMVFTRSRTATSSYESQGLLATRLIGTKPLRTTQTAGDYFLDWGKWDVQNSVDNALMAGVGTQSAMLHGFQRAPGFFDVVCYTGTGSATTQAHNLGVAPELMIVKRRDASGYNWNVYLSTLGASSGLWLNDTTGELTGVAYWNSTSPTSSVFSIGSNVQVNASGGTYVAYLFATVAGVSKVGSYTGNGSSQTINCGFTAGARFVLIKRTDSTGDWYVFDTARGIVSGNDPFLLLNSTAAEVTTRDAVDPDNSGFIVNNDGTNFPINVNNATYIYLAIA